MISLAAAEPVCPLEEPWAPLPSLILTLASMFS